MPSAKFIRSQEKNRGSLVLVASLPRVLGDLISRLLLSLARLLHGRLLLVVILIVLLVVLVVGLLVLHLLLHPLLLVGLHSGSCGLLLDLDHLNLARVWLLTVV